MVIVDNTHIYNNVSLHTFSYKLWSIKVVWMYIPFKRIHTFLIYYPFGAFWWFNINTNESALWEFYENSMNNLILFDTHYYMCTAVPFLAPVSYQSASSLLAVQGGGCVKHNSFITGIKHLLFLHHILIPSNMTWIWVGWSFY